MEFGVTVWGKRIIHETELLLKVVSDQVNSSERGSTEKNLSLTVNAVVSISYF